MSAIKPTLSVGVSDRMRTTNEDRECEKERWTERIRMARAREREE